MIRAANAFLVRNPKSVCEGMGRQIDLVAIVSIINKEERIAEIRHHKNI